MKKGLYFFWGDELYNNAIGENRKVLGQISAFKDSGIDFKAFSFPLKQESLLTKVATRIPFSNCIPIWKYSEELHEVDFIYFRRPPYMNFHMYNVLHKIKTANPDTIIMMEIPTFPYDKEVIYRKKGSIINYPILMKDKLWRGLIHNVIDYIVTPAETGNTIWNCPVLHISNGLILDDYSIRKPVLDDTIDLLAVANFKEWHGYERIIRALYNYSGNRDIVIHMVGGGTELSFYKELVSMYSLQDHVKFYGQKVLNELDDIYNKADIGLCSFGAYKKGLYLSKELKSREYLAKGLPIISGCELDILKKGDPGYLLFPNDSSDISMEDIVSFYDHIYGNKTKESIALNMRMIAEKYADMRYCMESVIKIMKR